MEEEEEEKKPFDGCQQNKRRHRHREVYVELNPGPRDKRGESGLHVVEV